MMPPFLMSEEQEWLTILAPDNSEEYRLQAVKDLYEIISRTIPTVRAWRNGIHMYLGKLYLDTGHRLEAALSEYDSPYGLAQGVEQIQDLVARATAELLSKNKKRLTLVANNVSGVLSKDNPCTSGCHENYLTPVHPRNLGEGMLAHLATRTFYSGHGNWLFPDGVYLASTRAYYMRKEIGGSTTDFDERALHSLARDENHTGGSQKYFRYHLICGDALRSQRWGIALRAGVTTLVLHAIQESTAFLKKLPKLKRSQNWISVLHSGNVLAKEPGVELEVDPLHVEVQRIYFEAVTKFVQNLGSDAPDWNHQILADWNQVLTAVEERNFAFLNQRLDCFIKYQLLSQVVQEMQVPWRELVQNEELVTELTLIGQQYHEFSNPDRDLFRILENAGAIHHRFQDRIEPGHESEPYLLPHVQTRAQPRARLIRDCSDEDRENLRLDWSQVVDMKKLRRGMMQDPLNTEDPEWEQFSPQQSGSSESLLEFLEYLTPH